MRKNNLNKKNFKPQQTPVFLTGISSDYTKKDKIKAIQKAAKYSTDFSWLSINDSVFIKPVVNSGKQYPTTTDPDAITAIIKLLKDKGAGRVVVGDLAGIGDVRFYQNQLKGNTRKLMEQTGIEKATRKAGGDIYCFEDAGWDSFYSEKPLKSMYWKKPIMMPSILKDMDHIILLPRCGRHMMAGSTLGLKAAVGYWRTDTRMELHRDAKSFYEKIVEGNHIPTLLEKQRLILTIASRVLTTYGPNEGYVSYPKTGLIISSQSILGHDMASLAWLLENRNYTPEAELLNHKETNERFVKKSNKYTVLMLSRKRTTALRSQRFVKQEISTIWEDRVLDHAFSLFDGIPNVNLISTNKIVSDDLLKKLKNVISHPIHKI